MFIIKEIFIEDKNLVKVLTGLTGLVLNMSPPQPVLNATVTHVKKGKKVSAASSGGSIRSRFHEAIKANGSNTSLNMEQLHKLFVEAGSSNRAGISTALAVAVEEKILTRRGRGQYVVI